MREVNTVGTVQFSLLNTNFSCCVTVEWTHYLSPDEVTKIVDGGPNININISSISSLSSLSSLSWDGRMGGWEDD